MVNISNWVAKAKNLSYNELNKRIEENLLYIKKNPEFENSWVNEYIGTLKAIRAEKLGTGTLSRR